jgi:hypothetical protein
MRRTRRHPAVAACVGLLAFAACASTRGIGGASLDPRFVAVHNTLAAIGLAQVGPIHEGTLSEAREARISLDLPLGCVTIVAIGGEGVRDIDATLLDPHGSALAHDTTAEPQAVLRACLESADTYSLVVKVVSGTGPWVVATWVGGASSGAPAGSTTGALSAPEAKGTCEAPIPLAAGTVSGSTKHGERENSGSCSPSDSRELVYELDVAERQRVTVEVEARFDSVLYIRKDECSDANAEVDCNDDAGDRTRSRVERVLDPGRYFVFVDGYSDESGPFKMTVTVAGVLALADVCRHAAPLASGATQAGTTEGLADNARATCGGGAEAADAAWRVDLASRSRVRLVEHSDDMTPVLHARRACADEQSEIACGESGAAAGDATVTGIWDTGAYSVFADGHERDSTGRYTLLLETSTPAGAGTRADDCGDASPLVAGMAGSIGGDTFDARDDVAGSCGGAGAPDVVYRLEVAKRSRFVASLEDEEAPHVMVLWRRCGERSAEAACGRSVDEVLGPGAYFIGVDGSAPEVFGRFALKWALRDLTGQAAACRAAPTLVDGRAVDGTTIGAGDRFAPACAASDIGASGPDRVFKFVLPTRSQVRLIVTATAFDAAVELRRACGDGAGGPALPELGCEAETDGNHHVTVERWLEAGTYWVVVDGRSPSDEGPFTIEYRVRR